MIRQNRFAIAILGAVLCISIYATAADNSSRTILLKKALLQPKGVEKQRLGISDNNVDRELAKRGKKQSTIHRRGANKKRRAGKKRNKRTVKKRVAKKRNSSGGGQKKRGGSSNRNTYKRNSSGKNNNGGSGGGKDDDKPSKAFYPNYDMCEYFVFFTASEACLTYFDGSRQTSHTPSLSSTDMCIADGNPPPYYSPMYFSSTKEECCKRNFAGMAKECLERSGPGYYVSYGGVTSGGGKSGKIGWGGGSAWMGGGGKAGKATGMWGGSGGKAGKATYWAGR